MGCTGGGGKRRVELAEAECAAGPPSGRTAPCARPAQMYECLGTAGVGPKRCTESTAVRPVYQHNSSTAASIRLSPCDIPKSWTSREGNTNATQHGVGVR